MSGSLLDVAMAAAAFVSLHVGIAGTSARDRLVERVGEDRYRAVFATLAMASLIWLCVAYANAPVLHVWTYAPWQSWVPALVMPVAVVLLVCGLAAPNPTSTGQEHRMDEAGVVRGVLRITRNPGLWGIGLWGAAHLVPNGDAASLILFGSIAALALGGSVSLDRKLARRRGAAWTPFAAATSNPPFAAVLQGRQRIALEEIDARHVLIAFALYVLLVLAHPIVFGVPAMPV